MSDVSHAGVTVGNLDRSIWFYTEVLGLELKSRYVSDRDLSRMMWNTRSLERVESAMVQSKSSEQQLQLTEATGEFGVRQPRATGKVWDVGASHLCFAVDDLASVVRRLETLGIAPWSGQTVRCDQLAEGLQMCFFSDPDGVTIELVQVPKGFSDGEDQGHVGVTVSDLDRSIWYYRDLLGMDLVHRYAADLSIARAAWNAPELRALDVAVLRKPGLVQRLEILQVHGFPQEQVAHRQWDVGFTHMCLNIADIEGLVSELGDHDVYPRAYVPGAGIDSRFVANSHIPDLDGFDLELVQRT